MVSQPMATTRKRKDGPIERPGPFVLRTDGLRRRVRVGDTWVD